MRLILAVRVFFLVLFSGEAARRVAEALREPGPSAVPAPVQAPPSKPQPAPKPAKPVRSEAVTLLAALQREARFVDFVQEPLADYTDAQIGAAARQVHRDCGQVLDRLFGLKTVLDQPEGSEVELREGFDVGRFRLTGNVAGQAPFRGRLVHHGWEATRCELPAWSGSAEAARVIAPAEVEVL